MVSIVIKNIIIKFSYRFDFIKIETHCLNFNYDYCNIRTTATFVTDCCPQSVQNPDLISQLP